MVDSSNGRNENSSTAFFDNFVSQITQEESLKNFIIQQEIFQQASVVGFVNIFRFMMILALLLIPFIFLTKKIKIGKENSEEVMH